MLTRDPGLVTILGVDPGYSMGAYAVADVDPSSRLIVAVREIGVIKTSSETRLPVRKSTDDLERAEKHSRKIRDVIARYPVDVVAAEMATRTPYLAATFAFGVNVGILASLDKPIIEVLPYEVKWAATGNDRATKRDVVAWALTQPSSQPLDWPTSARSNKLNLRYAGKNVANEAEHPADAIAVIQAAIMGEQFRLANSLLGR